MKNKNWRLMKITIKFKKYINEIIRNWIYDTELKIFCVLQEQFKVLCVVLKALIHFTEKSGWRCAIEWIHCDWGLHRSWKISRVKRCCCICLRWRENTKSFDRRIVSQIHFIKLQNELRLRGFMSRSFYKQQNHERDLGRL